MEVFNNWKEDAKMITQVKKKKIPESRIKKRGGKTKL